MYENCYPLFITQAIMLELIEPLQTISKVAMQIALHINMRTMPPMNAEIAKNGEATNVLAQCCDITE